MRSLVLLMLVGCGRIAFDPLGDGQGPGGDGGGGDGSLGDGGVGIDALVIPGCGSHVILADDFEDGVIASAWTIVAQGNITVDEAVGTAHFVFTANTPANVRGAYRQIAIVDFNLTCAIAELVQVPAPAASAYAYLRIGTPTKYFEMFVQGSQLFGRFNTAGSSGTIGPVPYNPVAQHFLRIRNTGGTSYSFEAGPSVTQFPTLVGTQGGAAIDPSPGSLELGTSTNANPVVGAGKAGFQSVLFLGP